MFSSNIHTIALGNDSGGEHIDPVATDVLATTGDLPAGRYLCVVTIVATSLDDSKALFAIQHRDSTDDEDTPLESLIVAIPVDDAKQFEMIFALEINERVSVVPYQDTIGTVMAAINWQRVS